jgi:radical SAM protein with 4Fe4S-binding SPASM domain
LPDANSISENKYLAESAYHRGDVVVRSRPVVFAIESTNFCNIKCVMCPRGEPDLMRRPLGHMSNELLERILDQAEFFAEPTWLHWFGEPLMNPNLFEHINIAKRKIPNLGISTNATLLRADKQRSLLESPIDMIMIAVDGDTKETYESIRKSDRFGYEQVCSNVEEFLSAREQAGLHKAKVILSIIDMESSAGEMEAFRDHWLHRGADQVIFKPYVDWAGQNPDVFGALGRSNPTRSQSPRPFPCLFLWESLVIAWDGRVVPCCFDYDAKMPLGDLRTQTLEEIWNGPAYVALRKAELAGCNNSELCGNCTQAPWRARDPNRNSESVSA